MEENYLLVLGSLIADMELCYAFGVEITAGKWTVVRDICLRIGRSYLLDDNPLSEEWKGPSGPMILTGQRRELIQQLGISYSYPQVVLLEEEWNPWDWLEISSLFSMVQFLLRW